MAALFIILTACCIAISCGLLGSFLILRKMAMLGDAISHAVLPGIVIAFLVSGSRDNLVMLAGAAATGVITTLLIELLHKKARLQQDAAIGISFTWLFAIGVILVSAYTGQVDLDQECVLYGEIAYIPLDPLVTGSGINLGPRALYTGLGLLLLVILAVVRGYKGWLITSFDEGYARGIGIRTRRWQLVFMSLVSLATVISFESVGAILVVALLVAPPAAAYLLSGALRPMLWLTALFGVLTAAGGYYLAWWIDGSIAGAMATFSGLLFVSAWIVSRWRNRQGALPEVH